MQTVSRVRAFAVVWAAEETVASKCQPEQTSHSSVYLVLFLLLDPKRGELSRPGGIDIVRMP